MPAPASPPVVARPVPAPATPGPDRSAPVPPAADAPLSPTTPASTADLVVATALSLRGTPYRNGGSDPNGFDCSGFTQWVFAQAGTRLPRETRDQFGLGDKVNRDGLQPGDLIFFRTEGRRISHVGISLGDDRFVHAPSSRGVVRVESMELPYWKRRFAGIRRIVGTN